MSILISKNGKTCQQFESLALKNKLFMHVASIEEIEKHQFKLIKSSKSSTDEFEASKKELFNKVTMFPIPSNIMVVKSGKDCLCSSNP